MAKLSTNLNSLSPPHSTTFTCKPTEANGQAQWLAWNSELWSNRQPAWVWWREALTIWIYRSSWDLTSWYFEKSLDRVCWLLFLYWHRHKYPLVHAYDVTYWPLHDEGQKLSTRVIDQLGAKITNLEAGTIYSQWNLIRGEQLGHDNLLHVTSKNLEFWNNFLHFCTIV